MDKQRSNNENSPTIFDRAVLVSNVRRVIYTIAVSVTCRRAVGAIIQCVTLMA